MRQKLKKTIKNILPPIFIKLYAKSLSYGWKGNFCSWKDAQKKSLGYDSDLILKKVSNSLLKVKNKQAIFERDSVLFNEIQYDWPLLASLLKVASANKGSLSVLDFGGSLGSTYFQNKKFFEDLNIKWCIVEQKLFVEEGRKKFQDKILTFEYDIKTAIKKHNPDVILFSGVLQYIDNYYDFLEQTSKIKYVIVDKTPFDKKEYITIQKVPKMIYSASYPCRIFEEKKFLKYFRNYELIEFWENEVFTNRNFKYKGFFFKLLKF